MIGSPPPPTTPPRRYYYCAKCDEPITDEGMLGTIMQYDESGVYHVRCFEDKERERREAPDPAWD